MAHHETPTSIPPFAEPLVPYIKSRQDALRIRQSLTAYLHSQVVSREDGPEHQSQHAQSHLALCVPHDAVDFKPIPPDITGMRRQYLEALQANAAARKKYQATSEEVISARVRGERKDEAPDADADSELQTYLRLLRGRQRHAKLQVFQHYLEELKSRDVAGSEYFENQAVSQPFAPAEQLDEKPEDGVDTEGLVHKLERAVIRAKSQLDKEKKLFEEAKARYESDGAHEGIPSTVKAKALQRTRDELVQWIEEKLVNMGGGDEDPVQELPPEELADSVKLLEEHKVQIATQYAAYVEARMNLLDAASKTCQPVGAAAAKSQPPSTPREKTVPEKTASLYPLDALAFTTEKLLPLSKTQRALALQKSYLSAMLGKEKTNALRMLNRLSDESHLLPEYPIPARQPRFKHAAAAHSRRASSSAEPPKPDEVVSLAEAWSFASEAAGENEREYVEQKTALGDDTTQDAEKMLQEVYVLLNQDLDAIRRSPRESETDSWSQGAHSTSTKPSREKQPTGVWAGLDGRVEAD